MRAFVSVLAMVAAFAGFTTGGGSAQQVSAVPQGAVVLEVSGAIANRNRGDRLVFDMAMLDRLEQASFTTTTAWTDGETRFQGVSGKAFIRAIGATGKTIKARALNDYVVEIPVADFTDRGAIIATRVNGVLMPVREKGPLWVVYPYDSNADLRTKTYQHRSIWQLAANAVE